MRFPPVIAFLLLSFSITSTALKFELAAQPQAELTQRCIRNFVGPNTLVVVTALISGSKGDGQRVNIEVLPSQSD
jgi:p24 family protein delta-1